MTITMPGVAPARPDRKTRRRLAEQDRRSAQLAELRCARDVLHAADEVLAAGWRQHDWFGDGRACLVGAIVQAAGGPSAAGSQLVHRTIELTWHTLHRRTDEPVRWCPPPQEQLAHVRDLARWNDRPGRTAAQVSALLHASETAARVRCERLAERQVRSVAP